MKKHGYKQGLYNPLHAEKYIGTKPIIYRSGWELKFFRWCDKNTNVLKWGSESVIIPYISPVDGRAHRYFVDNLVIIKEGAKIVKYLVEIKPKKQTIPPVASKRKKRTTMLYESQMYVVNRAKWEAAKKWCKKKGYKFVILTEDQLFNN